MEMIGLKPRSIAWVLPHYLAIGERPGGSGTTHRRIRREEEVCWLEKQEFGAVISLLPTTHNLQAYDEVGIDAIHLPMAPDEVDEKLPAIFEVLDDYVVNRHEKVYLHGEDVDDLVVGICGAYLLHIGAVPDLPTAVATIERVTSRPLGNSGRAIVASEEIGTRA